VEQEFPNKEETAFRVVTQGTVRAIKPEIRNEIYRIGREAIVNAYVHSEGSTIEVEVQYGSAQLRIFVRDDKATFGSRNIIDRAQNPIQAALRSR